MKEIEARLYRQKDEIECVTVPEELEARLRAALANRRPIFRWNNWKVQAVAGLLLFSLLGYHSSTLAYYGKKLLGYDQIMSGTLQQLNEQKKGQVIGQSYAGPNGITVTLDGIMLDGNQLLAFYTLSDPAGQVDTVNFSPFITVKGLVGTYRQQGSSGIINEAKTEIKYIGSFQPPYFFEQSLRMHFSLATTNDRAEGTILFTLDRNQAMGYTLKKPLNQDITVNGTRIRFDTLAASPTTTVISGTIQNTIELAMDQIRGERLFPGRLTLVLWADGEIVPPQGAGMSTDHRGITFHQDFDALPAGTRELQLQLVGFSADHTVNQQYPLAPGEVPLVIEPLGQTITINEVRADGGDTWVTLTTLEGVLLSKVRLNVDGVSVNLQDTAAASYEKKTDGTILHTRTLHFPGTGPELQLDIQRLQYTQTSDHTLVIPVD